MNENDLAEALAEALHLASDDEALNDFGGLEAADTFAEAGLMTNNEGLVLRFGNGAEFQLTIVQSAESDDFDEEEDEF